MNLQQFIAYAESVAVSAFEKTVVAVLKHLASAQADRAAAAGGDAPLVVDEHTTPAPEAPPNA